MIRVLSVFFLAASAWTAAAQPLPVEEFFKRSEYSQMVLSPDGRHIAAVVRGAGRDALAVVDVDKRSALRITKFKDGDILDIHWTNNTRLLFSVGEDYEATGDRRFFGWYAVNADGSDFYEVRVPGFRYLVPDPERGDDIVIEGRMRQGAPDVYRYNTKSGRMTLLTWERPSNPFNWRTDHKGVPRLAASYYKGIATIWYRDAEGQPWRKMHEAELNKLDVDPIMFDFDDRTLFVASGDDKLAIHVYDFQNNRVGERLARHLDVDMHEIEANEATRKILGFRYDAEKRGAVWIDQHVARLQQLVDKALPDRVNRLSVADENPKRALVMSYSDTVPAEFYVLDTENFKLAKLAASRPWIKPSEMSERKFVRYKSRDGLEIPGYLTIPRQTSGKNLPLVVVIHGGPWIRKHSFGFDVQAQFFASRGYAVFQPDYRGTIGYGNRHYTSGFEQWGLAMQDDITDGVEWLVRERIADKNRICLFGFNYGGYATLWGLIKTPELYRCGVTYGAITSIEQVFSFNARSPNVWDKDLERIRIGDPDRDGDKFRSLSPLYRVDGLKASVLVAFGAADQVVPVRHATAFRSALDRAGKKYEWALYTDEGRAFGSDENRFDFYRRVEVFLKQHLN